MKQYLDRTLPRIAYFCMEYGLHEEFHIYSGGLGILAGDHLKSAKDLGIPLVGIGILWRNGYTIQLIGEDGNPYDLYPARSYDFIKDTGITVDVQIRGETVKCKVWLVDKYDNAPLYLLDADVPDNSEHNRKITSTLYGGSHEDRIAQEIILGIGGVRALRKLGITPEVYHFNEGHAVFAGLELIRETMQQDQLSFDEAWTSTRQKTVFTTHTPVLAGNETHSLETLEWMGATQGFTREQLERFGGNPFSMTAAGLRLSRLSNAVAELHCETANRMWAHLDNRSPIIGITNGVHPGTWQNSDVRQAYEQHGCIWSAHMKAKNTLIEEIRQRTGVGLNPNTLLVGFARRFAEYKRSDLIFRNRQALESLLEAGKLQLVFSGKAHPQDGIGKGIVSRIIMMSKKHPKSVVFLENYDMHLGMLLTSGCDVWLNNPRRPNEASGTSGMKASMNGVLNLSTLDGWWPEGCRHAETGWQFGNAYTGDNQDEHDLQCLIETLTKEVLPTYYENHNRWVQMMQNSIAMSHWRFSSTRMVKDYVDKMYT
jgi:starch phosphorylase